jgi:hypothetical protein
MVNTADTPACCLGKCEERFTADKNDFIIMGPLKVAWVSNPEKGFETPDCGDVGYQVLFFLIRSTFSEKVGPVEFALYVDGKKQGPPSYYGTLDVIGRKWEEPEYIMPGDNTVYTFFNMQPAGHTIKIVVDPANEIAESNENNNVVERRFDLQTMDLSIGSVEYDAWMEMIIVKIKRDKELYYCPSFRREIYVDGNLLEHTDSFFGFKGLQGDLEIYYEEPGVHEIKVVLDTDNVVEESNEANNEATFTITVPAR